jgi:pyridinium-3,5-biscarboxylic acid mononucleotide sulfurtransferase
MSDLARLRRHLAELGPVVVAFSGGADSSLLAWVANDVLGRGAALAVTAVSASLAPAELDDCRSLAAEWGLNYREVESDEASRPGYVANGPDRCWYCKDELMRCLAPLASSFGGARVVLGVNVDDLGDHRPGQAAARAAGALFPLLEAGFTKADVREVSRSLGLRTWDKPAAACLASRIPYGTQVSLATLASVAKAEAALAALGFRSLRVRHYGELARVELPLDDLERAVTAREQVVRAVRAAGYRYVTLDLEGLRSGNLNGALGLGLTGISNQERAAEQEVLN